MGVPNATNDEREKLAKLIRRHAGNISAIARDLGFTRQAITRHLEKHDLLRAAELARLSHHVPGPRAQLDPASPQAVRERSELLAALREGGHRGAAKLLGIGASTVRRRMIAFGIALSDYKSAP